MDEGHEELHDEITNFLQEKGPTREAVKRRELQQRAGQFINTLGYENLVNQTHEYASGEGMLRQLDEVAKFKPQTLKDVALKMKRVPDAKEAKQLLEAAMYGTFPEGSDRQIAFSIIEPSNTTVGTGFNRDGSVKNTEWQINKAETDQLAAKLIPTDFLKDKQIPTTLIGEIGLKGPMTLKNGSNTQELTIERTKQTDKKGEIMHYSYKFQLKFI